MDHKSDRRRTYSVKRIFRVVEQPDPQVSNPTADKHAVTVHEIFPEKTLDVPSFQVKPSQMRKMYDQGFPLLPNATTFRTGCSHTVTQVSSTRPLIKIWPLKFE